MNRKRIVGIDYGMARIGIALSDPNKIIASPIETIQNQKKIDATLQTLIELLNQYDIEEIVVGVPYKLNGKNSLSTDETLHFIEELRKKLPYPIKTWDERLTTVQVERAMKENALSRKKRTKVIDAACATLILQNYLDQKENTLVPQYA